MFDSADQGKLNTCYFIKKPCRIEVLISANCVASRLKYSRLLHTAKFEHIMSALKEFHWIPVEYRVTFKTAVLVHSIKKTGLPAYLRQLLQDYEPVRSLQSSKKKINL